MSARRRTRVWEACPRVGCPANEGAPGLRCKADRMVLSRVGGGLVSVRAHLLAAELLLAGAGWPGRGVTGVELPDGRRVHLRDEILIDLDTCERMRRESRA